jgi:hypothetical protein
MATSRIARRVVVGIAALLSLATTAIAIKVSPPPKREYASQVWIGFSVNDGSTLRLDLKPDGTGSGVLLEGDERELFTVTSWTLDQYALRLSVRFTNPEIKVSQMAGKFKTYLHSYTVGMLPNPEKAYERDIPGRLELAFDGSSIRFGLWPESELKDRIRRVSMAAPN